MYLVKHKYTKNTGITMAASDDDLTQKQLSKTLDKINKAGTEVLASTKKQVSASIDSAKATVSTTSAIQVLAGTAVVGAAVMSKSTDATKDNTKTTEDNTKAWRQAATAGSNFSNDMLKLQTSAAQARMEVEEFGKFVQDNGRNLAGLGGSVTRGSENFSQLSTALFKSQPAFDELTNLGLTTKEMNDLLVKQLSVTRVVNLEDETAVRNQIESTVAYNRQLDLTAKLTGQSRKQLQEEMMSKSLEARIQARFALIEKEKGHEAAQAARDNFLRIQQKMEENYAGSGTFFAEKFATQGAILSDGVANTQAAYQEYGNIVDKAAIALGSGQIQAADQFAENGQIAAAKMMNDSSNLLLATSGDAGGAIAAEISKTYEKNLPLGDSLRSVAESSNILLKTQQSYAEVLGIINENLRKSQAGIRTVSGKDDQVSGYTRGKLAAEQRAIELKHAPMSSMDDIRTSDGKSILDVGRYLGGSVDKVLDMLPNLQSTFTNIGQSMVNVFEKGLGDVSNVSVKDAQSIIIDGKEIGGRATGSLGSTGKLIEDFGRGTLTMLHGSEGVITENQLGNLAKGLRASGIESTINSLMSSVSGVTDTDAIKSVESNDIRKIVPSVPNDFINTISKNINSLGESVIGIGNQQGASEKNNTEFLDYYDEMMSRITSGNMGQFEEVKSLVTNITGEMNNNIQNATAKTPKTTPLNFNDIKYDEKDQRRENIKKNPDDNKPGIESTTINKPTVVNHESDMFKEMVKQLQSLNKQMGQLIVQSHDLGKKQVKATKSNSQNLYDH